MTQEPEAPPTERGFFLPAIILRGIGAQGKVMLERARGQGRRIAARTLGARDFRRAPRARRSPHLRGLRGGLRGSGGRGAARAARARRRAREGRDSRRAAARPHLPRPRCAQRRIRRHRQPGRCHRERLRHRLRRTRPRAAAGRALLPGLHRRHESGAAGAGCVFLPGRLGAHVARLLGTGAERAPFPREPPRRAGVSHHGLGRCPDAAARVRSARRPPRRILLRGDPSRELRGRGPDRPAAGAARSRLQGRSRAAARVAAARAPGRAESRLRTDERSHDQGGGLWLRAAGV